MSDTEQVDLTTTSRRTLLARGISALAALAGYRFMSQGPPQTGQLSSDVLRVVRTGGRFHLQARSLHLKRSRDAQRVEAGERLSGFAELLDGSGRKVGEFYAVAVATHAPFGVNEHAAGHVEHHTFNLSDGIIVGMGVVPPNGIDRDTSFAIVGGTGRFEGIRGSYVAKQSPIEIGGNGRADYRFNILH